MNVIIIITIFSLCEGQHIDGNLSTEIYNRTSYKNGELGFFKELQTKPKELKKSKVKKRPGVEEHLINTSVVPRKGAGEPPPSENKIQNNQTVCKYNSSEVVKHDAISLICNNSQHKEFDIESLKLNAEIVSYEPEAKNTGSQYGSTEAYQSFIGKWVGLHNLTTLSTFPSKFSNLSAMQNPVNIEVSLSNGSKSISTDTKTYNIKHYSTENPKAGTEKTLDNSTNVQRISVKPLSASAEGPYGSSSSSTALIIAIIIVVVVCSLTGFIAYKRLYAYWYRRHYSRVDFLIDGLYEM